MGRPVRTALRSRCAGCEQRKEEDDAVLLFLPFSSAESPTERTGLFRKGNRHAVGAWVFLCRKEVRTGRTADAEKEGTCGSAVSMYGGIPIMDRPNLSDDEGAEFWVSKVDA